MPGKKHLMGVSDKEQRKYEDIKRSSERPGHQVGRDEEAAARFVVKQHKARGR